MAKPNTQNTAPITAPTDADLESYVKGWEDDVRSLPMYNVRECVGAIVGQVIDVQILNAAGGADAQDRDDAAKAFSAFVVRLTKPAYCMVEKDRQLVAAGKEIFVHAAAIDHLDVVALDPTMVFEYYLAPELDELTKQPKTIKTSSGYSMPRWICKRNPTPVKRSEVTKQKPSFRSPAEFRQMLGVAKIHGVNALLGALAGALVPGSLGVNALPGGFDPKMLEESSVS